MNLNFTELFFDVELKDTRTLKFSNNGKQQKNKFAIILVLYKSF